jgi:hypothetical protein
MKEITDGKVRSRQVAFYGIGNLVFGGSRSRQGLSLIPLITFHETESSWLTTNLVFYHSGGFNLPVWLKSLT